MRDYVELVKALRCCSKIDARNNGCDSCPYEYCGDDCQNLCGCAADTIEELLDAVPHWVSVEHELPSRYETVLLNIQTCKDSYVTIGDYEPNELRFRDFADRNNQVYCGDIVTHWMPLPKAPEPPKEVE